MTRPSIVRAQLTVIDGGGKPTPKWRDFPRSLVARSPFDKEIIAHYRLARHDIEKAAQSGRRQPILDCWGCVIGRPPPVPNIFGVTPSECLSNLTSLKDAHACYRRVKRPVGDDETGWDMAVYISKPTWYFEHNPGLVCIAKPALVAVDLVFAICVRLDNPREERYEQGFRERAPVRGVITHWEFLESDPSDDTLPLGHKERFRKRLW